MIHYVNWKNTTFECDSCGYENRVDIDEDKFLCDECHSDITRRVKRARKAMKLWPPVRYFIPGLPAEELSMTGDQWCFNIPLTKFHIAITLFKRNRWGR